MTRTGLRWVVTTLAALLVAAGCTGSPAPQQQENRAPQQVFEALPDRTQTGINDFMGDVASDGATVVIVGGTFSGATAPTFLVSHDAGASWTRGRLDDTSAAATRPSASEQADHVVRLRDRWYAFGRAEEKMIGWDSADGDVWRRFELDPTVLNADTDSVDDLIAVGNSLVAVGSRTAPGGDSRPMAWRSDDGSAWRRQEMPGKGTLDSVAAKGSVLVAVGSTEDGTAFLVERSSDGGRSWQHVSDVPRPVGDDGFRRWFSDLSATSSGFTAVGGAWTSKYVPVVYRSVDGMRWREERVPIGSSGSSTADAVTASGRDLLITTSETERPDRMRAWTRHGDRWSEIVTPVSAAGAKSRDVAWFVSAVVAIGNGWTVVVKRQDNGLLGSEIWRSTSPTGKLARISVPPPAENRPFVWPADLAVQGTELVVGGRSQGLPVVWRGSGTTFGPPQPLSTNTGDAFAGLASSGEEQLAYGSRLTGVNHEVAVTWHRSGSGSWSRTPTSAFQTSSSAYAYSRIESAVRIRNRWYVVGERSDNGAINESALVFSSTDGRRWAPGKAASVTKKGRDASYDVSDLSGSDKVTRTMTGITGTARGLVAVGAVGRDDKSSAAGWRSTDGNVWTLVPIAASGFDRSWVSAVTNLGPTTVAIGAGWRPGSPEPVPLTWSSTDGGRMWQMAPLPGEEPIDSTGLQIVATSSQLVAVAAGQGSVDRPLAWRSRDGRTWQPFELSGTTAATDAETVTLLGVRADGSDVVGVLHRSTLAGTASTLFRQRVE